MFIADRGHAMSAQRDTIEGRSADPRSSSCDGRFLVWKQRLRHYGSCCKRAGFAGRTPMETKPGYVIVCCIVCFFIVSWHAGHIEPSKKAPWCCKSNQVSSLKRKLQKRNKEVVGLQKQSGLLPDGASESFEEKVTERIAESDIQRKISRKLSRAGEAVTETEMEMDSLTTEINDLKQRSEEVMGQSWIGILLHHMRLLATQPTHIVMNSVSPWLPFIWFNIVIVFLSSQIICL